MSHKVSSILHWMWAITTLSKHFIIIEVSTTGLYSFRQARGGVFLGTATMAILQQVGTMLWLRERLKMEIKTSASQLAHALRTCPETLPGPATLRGLIFLRALCTQSVDTNDGKVECVRVPFCASAGGFKTGVECVEVIWQVVGCANGTGANPQMCCKPCHICLESEMNSGFFL